MFRYVLVASCLLKLAAGRPSAMLGEMAVQSLTRTTEIVGSPGVVTSPVVSVVSRPIAATPIVQRSVSTLTGVPSVGMQGRGMLGTGSVIEKTSVAERTPLGGVEVSKTSVRPSGVMAIESFESPGPMQQISSLLKKIRQKISKGKAVLKDILDKV
nr:unnamed protein product [Callosobruchus chinensis]